MIDWRSRLTSIWNKYGYTNFHELNVDYFITVFAEIFEEWESLYETLTNWKDATDTELTDWKNQTTNELNTWETNTLNELNSWKASTQIDISAWETAVLADLATWKTNFETLFNTTFANLTSIKTDAEAARDAAALSATSAATSATNAAASATSVSESAAQIEKNKNNITDLESTLNLFTGNKLIKLDINGYYNLSTSPVDLNNPTASDERTCGYDTCNAGDVFTINGNSYGNQPNLYAFLDSNYNIIKKYENAASAHFRTIVAPENSAYIVVNNYQNSVSAFKGYYIPKEDINNKAELSKNHVKYEINNDSWSFGGVTPTTGAISSSQTRIKASLNTNVIACTVDSDYLFSVFAWSGTTYIGWFDGYGFNKTSNEWFTSNDILNISSISNYNLLAVVRRADNTTMQLSEFNNFNVYYSTDTTLTEHYKAADSYSTGMAINNEANKREYTTGNKKLDTNITGWLNLGTSPTNLVPHDGEYWTCGYYRCAEGDLFTINGRSLGSGARIYGFIDSSFNILETEVSGKTLKNRIIKAPRNSYYLFINNYDNTVTAYTGIVVNKISELFGSYQSNNYLRYLDGNSVITSFATLVSLFDSLVTAYPNYITKNTLTSNSFTNYEYVFTTGNYNENVGVRASDNETDKPLILIISGVHGYERSSITGLYCFAKELCENDTLSVLKNEYTIKIIPCVCPYSLNNNTRVNENGVNINRNFNANWEYSGVGTDNFSGNSAADQDETQVTQNWMNANSNAIIMIDWHNSAYSDEITYLATPQNTNDYKEIKKAYFKGISNIITDWINVRKLGDSYIYSYTGTSDTGGTSIKYGDSVNIQSCLLETSWNLNIKDSAFTIGTGLEGFSAFLKELIKT